MAEVEVFEAEAGGLVLRGLRACPSQSAHGLVMALHGGGYDARYWHHPGQEALSLLLLGRMLGFDVIALDRPGYSGSADSWPNGLSLATQGELAFQVLDSIADTAALPTFLIGHSLGGILSLVMGGSERGAMLAGIDVSGVPLRFGDERHVGMRTAAEALIASKASHRPAMPRDQRRAAFFGADGSFEPGVVARGDTEHAVPVAEFVDAVNCPETLPATLNRITTPVQWTIADAENSSEGGPAVLAEAENLLANSRRVRTAIQVNSGHNISLHHVGRAYHLRAFAFFEECLAG